jgi:S-adenosylmethionine:tRNA ribosyltransferase-isomerase
VVRIEHRVFKDVVEYFSEGDALVINDTKGLSGASLFGNKEKTGAKIEVFSAPRIKQRICGSGMCWWIRHEKSGWAT